MEIGQNISKTVQFNISQELNFADFYFSKFRGKLENLISRIKIFTRFLKRKKHELWLIFDLLKQ